MDTFFFTLKEYLNGNLTTFCVKPKLKPWPMCLIPANLVIFLHLECNFLLHTSALLNIFYPFLIVPFFSVSALLLGLIFNKCNLCYVLS